jgi:DNA replication factor GINS
MNLDELQSVQARERQSSDLQHLRASFYREVGGFIRELAAERAEAVEAADHPFSAPAVRQLSDDIETAEQTVEAIYERRVGKVVKKASIAAAGMPVDDDGLTDEEAALFDDLVERIEDNRESVLSALDDDAAIDLGPSNTGAGTDDGEEGAGTGEEVTAAELMDETEPSASGDEAASMGTPAPDSDAPDPPDIQATDPNDPEPPDPNPNDPEPTEADPSDPEPTESEPPDPEPADATTNGPPDPDAGTDGDPDPPETGTDEREPSPDADDGMEPGATARGVPGVPRTTVRITAEVGEIVGADDRDYDLSPEDVVTLPEPNAEVLLDNDAAERLEYE